MKKEKEFPYEDSIGWRIYDIRKNKLGMTAKEFYNFLYPNPYKRIEENSIQKNVHNWEHVSAPLDVIKLISEKTHISTDYIIGNIKETTHDLHYISQITGLSEDAIKSIARLKNQIHYGINLSKTLSDILETPNTFPKYNDLERTLISAGLYKKYRNMASNKENKDYKNVPYIEKYIEENNVPVRIIKEDELANVYLQDASKIFVELLESDAPNPFK